MLLFRNSSKDQQSTESDGAFDGVDIPIEKANPRALEIDAAGDWWVVLGARHMVARYSPNTRTWRTWPGGFYPHSLALAADGGVWMNGHFTHSPELIARVDTTVRDSSRALTRFEVPAPTKRRTGFTVYPLPSRGALVRHLAIDPRTRDLWSAYGASPGRIPAKIARLQLR